MNSAFSVEDDWCASPLNLGTPSLVNPDVSAQAQPRRQSSSPLKLTQRQRQQQNNLQEEQACKIYVEPTVGLLKNVLKYGL